MTVSERIFDLLKKQGKKQGDLARALNVRPTTVSESELSGEHRFHQGVRGGGKTDAYGIGARFVGS